MTLEEVRKKTIDSLSLKDTTADPAPLGLLGFGLTTVLLNFHNAGFYELNTMILAMGIFYGGIAQIIAERWSGRSNTFGTTAFTSYGLFWLSLVASLDSHARSGTRHCHFQAGLCSVFLYVGAFYLRPRADDTGAGYH